MAKASTKKPAEKQVTIVMPVGTKRGKKVKMSEFEALHIEAVHGKFAGGGSSAAKAVTDEEAQKAHDKEIVDLQSEASFNGTIYASLNSFIEQIVATELNFAKKLEQISFVAGALAEINTSDATVDEKLVEIEKVDPLGAA